MNFKKKLEIADFKAMHHLEMKYYDDSHITPYEEAYRWYLTFPWSNCALYDDERLVGFLDLFPIKQELYEKICAGKYNDINLKVEDIVDVFSNPKERVHMFLCCIVIEEEYRKTDALNLLFKRQIEFYKPFVEKGLQIGNVITDNVTPAGDRFSKRLGFRRHIESTHDSVINICDYLDFVKRIEEL